MKTLYQASTRGGKYALHAYENESGPNPINAGVMVESLTNGVMRGCMGPVTKEQAAKWVEETVRGSAEVDGIHYREILNLLTR